jgi:O-antigen/teichoic acid export membrane protein
VTQASNTLPEQPQTQGAIDRKDVRNSILVLGAEGIGRALAIVLSVLIARQLGAEAFGDFSTAQSIALIFSVFFEIGLYILVLREVAQSPQLANRYLLGALTIEVLFSGLITIILYGIIRTLGYSNALIAAILLCWLWVIGIGYGRIIRAILRAYGAFGVDGLLTTCESIMRFGLIVVILMYRPSVVNVSLMFAISSIATSVVGLWIIYRRYVAFRFQVDLYFLQQLVLRSLPFALTTIFSVSLYRIDTVLLSVLRDSYEVGIYNAAYRLNLNFFFIPAMICSALFPKLSALGATNDAQSLNAVIAGLYRILTLIVFPLLVLIFLGSELLIMSLYGPEYREAIRLLQALVWVNLLTAWNYVATYSLNALGEERSVAFALGMALLANTLLNLLLIPALGYYAATFASIMTEITSLVILHWFLHKHVEFPMVMKLIEPKGVGLILLASVTSILPFFVREISFLLTGAVFVGVYCILTIGTGLARTEMELLLKPIWTRR